MAHYRTGWISDVHLGTREHNLGLRVVRIDDHAQACDRAARMPRRVEAAMLVEYKVAVGQIDLLISRVKFDRDHPAVDAQVRSESAAGVGGYIVRWAPRSGHRVEAVRSDNIAADR